MLVRSLVFLLALGWLPFDAGAQGAVSRDTLAEIQSMLGELGYQPGPADGVMGERTRQAIRRYQGSAGLAVDGAPSIELRDSLRVATGRAPGAPAPAGRRAAWTGSAATSLTLYSRPQAASATARVLPAGTAVDVFRR
ncbi:MAG: peptidoglycan-binding domain-containing protein, partial [Gammaproteobacteria bacterium]|nr:peptidoglycan-binding domain-containing protein [Gammaproteobacteria bacterium]